MKRRPTLSFFAPSDRDYASGLGYDEPARICPDCDHPERDCTCGPELAPLPTHATGCDCDACAADDALVGARKGA